MDAKIKVLFIVGGILLLLGGCIFFGCVFKECSVKASAVKIVKDIETAMKKESPSIVVISNLKSLVKECILTTESGIIISKIEKPSTENILFKDFNKKKSFDINSRFKITIVDRYGLNYEKTFNVNPTGVTEVVIDKEDYTKNKGDTKRKIEKILNGE